MPTLTAMYEKREDAERVQAELERLGIIDTDGMNVHDRNSQGHSDDQYSNSNNRGFWGSSGSHIPDEDRHTYEEGVRRGHYLLTVNTDDQSADRVHQILENSSAVDVDEKASSWRKEGWTAPAAAGLTGAAAAGAQARDGREVAEEHIPIVEEQLKVGKREVSRGGVRVRSYTEEKPVHEQVRLREEHVEVQRRPVDQPLGAANLGGDPFQERQIELTETAEEAVVAKEARVVEEVVVRKDVEEHQETISDTVRRTHVDVDQLGDTSRDRRDEDPINRR